MKRSNFLKILRGFAGVGILPLVDFDKDGRPEKFKEGIKVKPADGDIGNIMIAGIAAEDCKKGDVLMVVVEGKVDVRVGGSE